MRLGDAVDIGTVATPIVGQSEQRPHLIERETQIARAPDERQPPQFGTAIIAVISGRAPRLRQQADPFVIADGFDLGVGRLAEIADRQRSDEHTSEPKSLMSISYTVFSLKK